MIIKLSHKLGQNADTALSYLRSLSRNNEYKLYVNKIPVSEPPTLLNTQLSHNLRIWINSITNNRVLPLIIQTPMNVKYVLKSQFLCFLATECSVIESRVNFYRLIQFIVSNHEC